MDGVNRREWPRMTVEAIYQRGLDEILGRYGLSELTKVERAHLIHAWCRLRPWPDALTDLARLRRRCVISTLSNASLAGMMQLAKFAHLPWDCNHHGGERGLV